MSTQPNDPCAGRLPDRENRQKALEALEAAKLREAALSGRLKTSYIPGTLVRAIDPDPYISAARRPL